MTIDIIMPCYYSNEVITPALEKIANQTAIDKITLIMVNDCSPYTNCEYQDLIDQYKSKIKIRYLKTEKRSGPGIARQLGLDNAQSDWVIFHDDDDELYDKYSIEHYIKEIEKNPEIISATGKIYNQTFFAEANNIISPSPGSINNTLFKKEILKQLNIHFESLLSFREEDGCFRDMFALYTKDKYLTQTIDVITYIHKMSNFRYKSLTSGLQNHILILLNLLGYKAYCLSYIMDLSIYEDSVINEGIGLIPNLFIQLYNYLQNNNEKLTETEYNNLKQYLNYYIAALNYYKINYNNLNKELIEELASMLLNDENYYGIYKWENIINFNNNYKDMLEIIYQKYTNHNNSFDYDKYTIDIIMPCYYSNNVIIPALESIAKQTLINQITLIMVNDSSPNTSCEYQDLIQKYSNKIKIKYLKTSQNSGPGETRQLGLNNTTSDFIMFLDDDDELYAEDTVEQLIKQIQNQDINEIISISGKIQINNNHQREEVYQIQKNSVQGTLFNRILLKHLRIYFEPVLSFKEEDGCFSSLVDIKGRNYQMLSLDEVVYIRNYYEGHESITSQCTTINSILAMIYLKIFPLKYLYEENIIHLNTFNLIIIDAISFIPNLLNALIDNFIKDSTQKITQEQFLYLITMLSLYIYILDTNNIKIQDNNLNLYFAAKNFFNGKSFYGSFDLSSVLAFKNNYLTQLQYIQNYFVI